MAFELDFPDGKEGRIFTKNESNFECKEDELIMFVNTEWVLTVDQFDGCQYLYNRDDIAYIRFNADPKDTEEE